MNIKKYFNFKIVIGLVVGIAGIILYYYDFISLICPANSPLYNCSLSIWIILSIIPLIIIAMLVWRALEKMIQRIGKSTKVLNIVMVIVLVVLIICLCLIAWLRYHHPILSKPILPIETNSIIKLKQSCVIDNGNAFNDGCEGKSIEMENLYLYSTKSNDPSDGFYLYDSGTHSTYSDSIDSDLLMQIGDYITVYAGENLELLDKIRDKVTTIEEPISVNIKGTIKSSQLCTQNSRCKFGLFIVLDDITYNESSKDDGYITTEEYEKGRALISKAVALLNGYIRYLSRSKTNNK